MKYLWDQLRECTTNKTKIPSITPQSSILYLMSPSNFIYSLPETNSLDTEYLKAITE